MKNYIIFSFVQQITKYSKVIKYVFEIHWIKILPISDDDDSLYSLSKHKPEEGW